MSAVVWQNLPADVVTRTRSRPWLAFGSAIAIEVTVVLALLAWLAMRPTQVPDKTVPITIEVAAPAITEEPPKPPEPAKAKPLSSLPKPVVRAVSPPLPVPQVVPAPTALPVTQAPSPVPATATPSNPPAQTPAPAPAPTQPPTVDPAPAYNAKIAAAAQAALEVPGTVTALNFKGRARVGFKLRDGVVSSIVIIQSSGLGAMDRAAAKAVQTANYPPPPAALQGKEIAYEIWVTHTPVN
jgi:protein TonB